MRRPLAMLLLAYLGVGLVFSALQTRLIFPGHETQGRPEAVVRASPGTELVTLETNRGDRIVALFGPALSADGRPRSDAPSRPTLLYFYGNAMCLRDASIEFDAFRRLGANVMVVEYAGYGMSGGRPGEAGCYASADAAYAHLRTRSDVDPARIVAGGWSLGAAVAADLADRRPVAGLVLFCAFTSMADMSRRVFPFLPASLLLRHRFETETKLARISRPTLIGHGRRDSIIPIEMADRLAASAAGPVTRITVEDADHNDFFAVGGGAVLDALGRFLDGTAPGD